MPIWSSHPPNLARGSKKMVLIVRSALLIALLMASQSQGAPAEDHWGAPQSADYGQAAGLVASAEYEEALKILQHLAEKSPGDADIFNLLGFSYRKTGDLERAEASYERALRLSPDHKGALAYQGELHLMLGNVAAAEANLARLVSLCPNGCDERAELERALAARN